MVFGKPSGYARMSPSVSQYYDVIANKIKTLAASRGVNVFGYGQLGISGDIADQAYVSGNSTSYLLEAGNWPAPTVSQIQSVLLPELLPFLIVFSQESEVVPQQFDGSFESGNFNAWTGTYITPGETATVVNTMSYQGNFSAKFTSNGTGGFEAAYCYEALPASSNLHASGYFYVSQSGIAENDDRFYLITFQAGGKSVAYAGWRRTAGVDRWNLLIRDATSWTSVYSNSNPSINRWYSLELYWTEDATDGHAELYVDGALACSIQNQNTAAFGDTNQVRFGLAEIFSSGPTTVNADSCQISGASPWDLNQDGKVDMRDLAILVELFQSTPRFPNWNPDADLNKDGIIDMRDIAMLIPHVGERYA